MASSGRDGCGSKSSPPPSKKSKSTTKTFYNSKFKAEWVKDYPILPANGNEYAFYCMACKKNVSCSHQGFADVQRHIKSATHISMAKALSENRKVSNMFFPATGESKLREATTKAEILHTNFIVQHNLAFLTSEHMTKLYPEMFPDSKIAKQFACSRTKTSCILSDAMMPSLKEYLTTYMKDHVFSIVNDGSSDTGLEKMNAVCTHIFDVNRSTKVEIKFYNMCSTAGEDCSKAETLFNSINGAFEKDGVSWKNCVSVGLDNTNVNMGSKNSIKSRILQQNANCFIAGCNCHLAHIAAGKGGCSYSTISDFDIEVHMVELCYFFKSSTRRKGILNEFIDFVGMEWENLGKYVTTRWLSLVLC